MSAGAPARLLSACNGRVCGREYRKKFSYFSEKSKNFIFSALLLRRGVAIEKINICFDVCDAPGVQIVANVCQVFMFLDGCNLKESFRYILSRLFSPFGGLFFLGAWLLATVTGPFGTFEGMAFEHRALYWLIITIGAFVLGYFCFAIALGLFRQHRRLATALTAAGFMTIVFTPYVYFVRAYFSTISEVLAAAPLAIGVNIFLMSVIIFVLRAQLVDDVEAMNETAESAVQPRLSRRLPHGIGRDVVRLEAQDHLIVVITMSGRETVRMRFGDAIEEMEPVDGFCTHRSHWVVEDAIVAVEQDRPGKIYVRMQNGDRVPVSRKYRPQLDSRGFEIR